MTKALEIMIYDIKTEMSAIKKDLKAQGLSVKEWECLEVEDMNGNEAFTRGYYRALESILSDIKHK